MSGARTDQHVIGIYVGTGSARAGLFDMRGELKATEKREIALFHEGLSIVEQSSEIIWRAVSECVRGIVRKAAIDPSRVVGLDMDATCSLVVVEEDGSPLPVGNPNLPERNIIVWMDHRAIEQAERINVTRHECSVMWGIAFLRKWKLPSCFGLRKTGRIRLTQHSTFSIWRTPCPGVRLGALIVRSALRRANGLISAMNTVG
jgi:D-ribulokinase